jgi:hypothetical protein
VADAHTTTLRVANVAKRSDITSRTTFAQTKELQAVLETPRLAPLLPQPVQTAGPAEVGDKEDTACQKKTEETPKVSAVKVHAFGAGA